MYLRFNSGMEDLMKYNKNASNSLFSERSAKNKVLIIVPHEDDETIIAGNIIDLLKLNGNDIKVAYLTNGDYSIPAEIRAKEAIHAIRTLGLNEDDVFFLGYPDTQFGENTSLIETTDKPYRSKAGKLETYCCNNFKEFCFQTKGIHHEYIGENVISDLEEIIKFLYPDIIICNDYDKHPDHMTVSYGIDMALDRIIREDINNTYRPLLWKSFAYSLGYFAKDLLKNSNINSTMVPDCDSVSSDFNIINKSIFQWNKRIRIPNSPFNNWNDFVYKQRLFKALACHKSQFAAFRIGRVWRGDEVYWERRTDSVLSNSEYYLNGREVKSLSNFCLYKAKNFSSNTLEFIDDSLVFNNNDELLIKCPKKSIEQIVIYGFIGSECERGRINLTLNNGFSRSFDFISKYGSPFNINIPRQNDIVWMRFHFSSKNKCKISRIEGFAEKQMNNSIIKPYIKILIDDNFTNHYYIPSKNRVLTVDLYRFKVEDSVNLKIVQGKADIINKNQIKILSLKKPIILRASCDSEPIYDQVTISKENNVVHNFKNLFNCIFLKLFRVNSHVYLFKRLCKAKGLKSAVLFFKRKMENK